MYTNIIHNDDICNYFLKNQQFIFNSLGNCRECRVYLKAPVYVFRTADGGSAYKVEFTQYQNEDKVTGHVKFRFAKIK